MNKIYLEKLTKVFETNNEKTEIFNIDSFTLYSNQNYAIKGYSGSGKSTFLQIIAGLDDPTTGSVLIEGDISRRLTNKDNFNLVEAKEKTLNTLRRNHFGFIYQKNFLIKDLSVLDNLLIVKQDKERAVSLLKSVGLEDRQKSFYSQLSGGERQRISICRALMNSPDFVFADEPTGALDFKNKEKIWELFMTLQKEHNFGLIMVTHDNELANKCENVYLLNKGVLVKEK